MKRSTNLLQTCLGIVFLLTTVLTTVPTTTALEAKFTPTDDGSGGGPLPQSQAMRDQLTQLDNALSQTDNPEEILRQVAEANSMSPDDLAGMLMRNREDMAVVSGGGGGGVAGGGGGGAANTLPRKILSIVTASMGLLAKSAQSNPRRFSTIASMVLFLLYVYIQIPRTGLVLSSGQVFLMSHGYTTVFPPPKQHVMNYIAHLETYKHLSKISKSKTTTIGMTRNLSGIISEYDTKETELAGGAVVEQTGKRASNKLLKDVSYMITAQRTMDLQSLLPDDYFDEMEDEAHSKEDRTNGVKVSKEEVLEGVVENAIESALSILRSRRLTEYAHKHHSSKLGSKSALEFVSSQNKDIGALVIPKLGDYRRYGIQPLRMAYEETGPRSGSLGLYTIKGGHFDGEIRFSVERQSNKDEEETVVISVALVIPKKGRKLKNSMSVVTALVTSIQQSAMLEAQKRQARLNQSTGFRNRTGLEALRKRKVRLESTEQMEAMDKDRRRRWQRSNPDAGHYRPSGRRMQSPNNC